MYRCCKTTANLSEGQVDIAAIIRTANTIITNSHLTIHPKDSQCEHIKLSKMSKISRKLDGIWVLHYLMRHDVLARTVTIGFLVQSLSDIFIRYIFKCSLTGWLRIYEILASGIAPVSKKQYYVLYIHLHYITFTFCFTFLT